MRKVINNQHRIEKLELTYKMKAKYENNMNNLYTFSNLDKWAIKIYKHLVNWL